jgi:superfamily I DNA/RNA helicase
MALLPAKISLAPAVLNHPASPQQQAVYDWTSNGAGSAIVEAVAGAGKTTTLIGLLARTSGTVAFTAYNKKIADEIASKVAPLGLGDRIKVGTVHSFGFSAIRAAFPRTQVDGKKLVTIAKRLTLNRRLPRELHEFAIKAASMAKQTGIGSFIDIHNQTAWASMISHHDIDELMPDDYKIEQGIQAAATLLTASNDMAADVIDFDDMVYLPAQRKMNLRHYDWVLLDEAQDTNATRRALARMMLPPDGRLVAVGDPAQAIYGFTGADSNSLDLIREDFSAITLPLTVSYRCPKAVVAEARRWVQHIEPAETAAEGCVETIEDVNFWGKNDVDGIYTSLTADDAILCRNTKPLVAAAYRLIRNGKGCIIEGRDIGFGLIKLATKWKSITTVEALRLKLRQWSSTEIARALDRGQDAHADKIEDQVNTLFEIMSTLSETATIFDVQASINSLFGDTPAGERPKVVTLSTIHKSKGREWKRVFWWGANLYQPSKYARQPWQQDQEKNIMYVAATRAMETLVHVALSKD